MIKTLKHWLVVVFLLLTVALIAWFKFTQPKILIIHSYGTDYSWTRDVDTGLKRVLDGNLGYKIQWHYMNTKRQPSTDFKRRAGILAIREIENYRPDLIIAIDDDAQKYAVKDYVNNPEVRILFAGINGSVEPYGYNRAPNVTGIYERKPLGSLRTALTDLRNRDGTPLGRRIFHIGDRSDAVAEDTKEIRSMDWSPFRLVDSVLVDSFDEWKTVITDAAGKADLIVISNFQNIARKTGETELMPPAEVMGWTEAHSSLPLVGTGGFIVEAGGMLAVGSSGFEQGEVVARMASDIIEKNLAPGEIPHVMPRQYLVYLRQAQMEKRGLKLPDIYEAFSRASGNYH